MKFEWDLKKEQINIAKHSIDFTTASSVFLDYYRIERYDVKHSVFEYRFTVIGRVAGMEIVLSVVYTERDDCTRIISARYATDIEKEIYYDGQL